MSGQLFFEIPDDQAVMAELVKAVPANWSWVDGGLYAPKSLITTGVVQVDTGFSINRFHGIGPTIIGGSDGRGGGKRVKPNLFAIMVEQKLPGFINFYEAGYESSASNIITLQFAQAVAIGFLLKGYRGSLFFCRDCYDNSKYENSARCDMIFQPWEGHPHMNFEVGPQPARVKLTWEERYRGREEHLAPIVAVCHSLHLREYTPEMATVAA